LNLGVNRGTNDVQGFLGTIGIDFARLTVHRTSGQNWWPNYPLPIARPPSE
jgi:hypothetical protein